MNTIGVAALTAFALTIPAANWMIGNVGTICVPDGPCLIPVGFGFMAPSGVLMVGSALLLRDFVQHALGERWTVAAILIGGALSGLYSPPSQVGASVAAFLLGEMADLLVYTPLQRRRLIPAVVVSNLVGSVIDSAVFLLLAFGSVDMMSGQIVGKMGMTAMVLPFLLMVRRRSGQILPLSEQGGGNE